MKFKLTVKGNYKSLSAFESDELSEFTVITGRNGSGKTQLIDLIKEKVDKSILPKNYGIEWPETLRRVEVNNLLISNMSSFDDNFWKNEIQNNYNAYLALGEGILEMYSILIDEGYDSKGVFDYAHNPLVLLELEPINKRFSDVYLRLKEELANQNTSTDFSEEHIFNLFFNRFRNRYYRQQYDLLKQICINKSKKLKSLKLADFRTTAFIGFNFDMDDLINSRVENIFYSYAMNRYLNEVLWFRKKEYGEMNSSISLEDFHKKTTKPWELINEIFIEHNLNYKFKGIEPHEFFPDSKTEFELVKISNGQRIYVSSLSKGEQVIISLISRLFSNSIYEGNLYYPHLMVLDEPDAYLDPETSKLMIDVLYKTFVKKLGIHIIITTHSPTTVALSPEESLYRLSNDPSCSLNKISKDEALKMLTGYIPNLSIDYNNHRQVFVESPTDRLYYQTVFDKLNEGDKYFHRLYFISNGYGNSNDTQVRTIVRDLRIAGNATSYGIIDWDTRNKGEDYIYVHGLDSRYSIENFIFDPVYLSILLLELEYNEIFDKLNLTKPFQQFEIIKDEDLLQRAVNYICSNIKEGYDGNIDETLIDKKYSSSTILKLPQWYLNKNGHDIKEMVLGKFRPFAGIEKGDNYGLEKRLIKIIGKVTPFVPAETIELFNQLGSRNKPLSTN